MTTSTTPAATSGTGTSFQKLKQSLRAATKRQDRQPNGVRRVSFVNPSLQQGSVSSPALQIITARTSLDDSRAPSPRSCPEIREAIRSATALLCREMVRPPPNLRLKDDWDHVERRLQPLIRAQRVWSKSPSPGTAALTSPAEERERKQFADAVRDGYVLCQLLNKLRSRSIVRPDPRESTKTNITKFLAACASLGLPDEELFAQDDLLEAGPESLARVARTILRLVDFVQREDGEEGRGRGKVIRNQGIVPEGKAKATIKTSPLPPTPTKVVSPSPSSSPYGRPRNQHIRSHPNSPTTSSRAAASTPNLLATPTRDRDRDYRLRDRMRSTSPLDDRPLPRTPVNRPNSRTATRTKLDDKMRPLPPSPPVPGPSSPKPNMKAKIKANGSASALNSDAGNDEDRGMSYASYAPPPTPPIIKPPPKSPLRKVSKVGMGLGGSGDGGGREKDHGREKEKEDRGQEKDKHSVLFSWARMAASPRTVTNFRAGVGSSGSNPALVSMGPGPSPPNPVSPRKPIARVNTPTTPMPTSIPSGVEELGIGVRMRSSIADSTRASMGDNESLKDDPFQSSPMPPLPKSTLPHPHIGLTHTSSRQSMSSDVTTTTVITTVSSLLDAGMGSSPGKYGKGYISGRDRSSGGNGNNANYATIRSVTTDMTSEPPASFGRSSSKSWVVPEENGTTRADRERRLSEVPGGLDLARVAEEREPDGSGCGEGDYFPPSPVCGRDQQPSPVNLRKGKWPDDFINAFGSAGLSESPSPPRKLAIVGRTRGDDTGAGPFPRRPTHRPRHSIDSPNGVSGVGLLPKEAVMARREASPERRSSPSPSGRVVLRRHSSNRPLPINIGNGGIGMSPGSTPTSDSMVAPSAVGGSRTGTPAPKPYASATTATTATPSTSAAAPAGSVPFPRTISAEYQSHHTHYQPSPTPRSSDPGAACSSGIGVDANTTSSDRSRLRGRFQSDIEGSSAVARRRARPSSYDELGSTAVGAGVAGIGAGGGGGPKRVRLRSRFESMVNLGASSPAGVSASDLLTARDSIVDGSDPVRHRLVVREDGKPPTHFQLGNCIGRGQFGSVYRALNLNTGQMVAVKRIRLEGLKEDEVTQLMREVDLVKSLSHPSIVKYEGMVRDEDMLNIILEYAENGSLGQTLRSFGKLNEALVARYVVKILEGLHYLHMSDVVHCDLKAANILTTKNGNVKLTDFGVSLNLRAVEREIDKDVAGTPNWMAPEVIELKGASTKSDIWSLGCTVIELLTGRPPYADIPNTMSVMFRIVEDPMPPLPDSCDELLKDFLKQCFNKDPSRRPSAEELCEHPWLRKNWSDLKDFRGQDSIPFIRRVSTDFQKNDAIRYLSQPEFPDSPLSGSPKDAGLFNPMGRRTSVSSIHPPDTEFSPREHTFVKTTFSKSMTCRVCLSTVKKSALLCSQCSLISHSKCAPNAPPTCDFRAQLLLYAQYAEKGNPASAYSNPLGNDTHQNVTLSDVAFVEHNRTSLDGSQPSQSPIVDHVPTAFRLMAAFKRSLTNLTSEPDQIPGSVPPTAVSKASSSDDYRFPGGKKRTSVPTSPLASSASPSMPIPTPRRTRPTNPRPLSVTSSSTGLSSLHSAATANESFSSRQNTGKRSQLSGNDLRMTPAAVLETVPGSRPTTSGRPEAIDGADNDAQLPGTFVLEAKKKKRAPSGCMVQ